MYYHLPYLISYLLFRKKVVLIFKGGLSVVRYQTHKTRSESCETKFVSVRPKYLSDPGKIYIFRNSSPKAILRQFFRFFGFSLFSRPGWKLVTLTPKILYLVVFRFYPSETAHPIYKNLYLISFISYRKHVSR